MAVQEKINQIQELLNKPNVDIITSVNQIVEDNKEKNALIRSLELKVISYTVKELLNNAEQVGKVDFIYKSFIKIRIKKSMTIFLNHICSCCF